MPHIGLCNKCISLTWRALYDQLLFSITAAHGHHCCKDYSICSDLNLNILCSTRVISCLDVFFLFLALLYITLFLCRSILFIEVFELTSLSQCDLQRTRAQKQIETGIMKALKQVLHNLCETGERVCISVSVSLVSPCHICLVRWANTGENIVLWQHGESVIRAVITETRIQV